jgi:hypothetical protein
VIVVATEAEAVVADLIVVEIEVEAVVVDLIDAMMVQPCTKPFVTIAVNHARFLFNHLVTNQCIVEIVLINVAVKK